MAGAWLSRSDYGMPYQRWNAFPPDAIVQVRSYYYPDVPDNIGPAKDFFWGYEEEFGAVSEGVISTARRLDRVRDNSRPDQSPATTLSQHAVE